MPRVAPFEAHHQRYEAWFEKHQAAYLPELLALRPFVPWKRLGLEIGVSSGRFAALLGVQVGVDPSRQCLPSEGYQTAIAWREVRTWKIPSGLPWPPVL